MITLQIHDEAVKAELDRLAAKLANLTPVLHDIGQALTERTRAGIASNKDWHGRPFAPNSPATLAKKKGTQPLIANRTLVHSQLHYEAGQTVVTLGVSAIQAAMLQFGALRGEFGKTKRGAPIPWGNIPARPFLPIEGDRLAPSAEKLVLEALQIYQEK